jgi:hypothetical protein
MNPGMQKRLLQVIALILVMTAALNAQCFATCAIASVAQQPDHACCPHHKSAHADAVQPPGLPIALAFEIAPRLAPADVTSLADFPTTAVLPPPNRPALTTALRL